MAKMWAGRTDGITSKLADDFNSSISVDSRMFRQDIKGSIAHAIMLGACGIIEKAEADKIADALCGILEDLESGALKISEDSEDIHMFIEEVLTERIGDLGKKLHTARSRNDQVALDFRLYLSDETAVVTEKLTALIGIITDKAEEYKTAVMPGYTHLQRAQPITFAHQLLAYSMMFLRDIERLSDCKKRICVSPIGSCALAGTTYPTDRQFEAQKLGLDAVCKNSIDGVSDRDFAVEFLSCMAQIMMHLSRFSEEIVLWSSWEFKFIELSDAFTTGSSIMPQKKNPDMAELVRGKTGRVYGDLIALFTVLKGLPLAYNKDMQEDKESVFDALDTVKACLDIFSGMLSEMKANTENMEDAAKSGFINATDLADYIVGKGVPFRTAYKISGEIVSYCIKNGIVLETVPLETYKKYGDFFDDDVYDALDLQNCVKRRVSEGGTGIKSIEEQIAWIREQL